MIHAEARTTTQALAWAAWYIRSQAAAKSGSFVSISRFFSEAGILRMSSSLYFGVLGCVVWVARKLVLRGPVPGLPPRGYSTR